MREIKFRYWNNGIMQYDFDGWTEDISINEIFEYLKKNKISIMQYVGKKDKNGKEIYEGDILKYDGEKCKHCGKLLYDTHKFYIMKWDKKAAQWDCVNDENTMSYWIWKTDMEIIGNIYENPELIEK